MGKSTKGVPTLKRQDLYKKTQEKDDEIKKKLYAANRDWNDCKFKLN